MIREPSLMFLHELALALGYTVQDLLAHTSSQELTDWPAFFAVRKAIGK